MLSARVCSPIFMKVDGADFRSWTAKPHACIGLRPIREMRNQDALGAFYQDGRGGLTQDQTEALRYYKLAADQKFAPAQTHLGTFYQGGLAGLPKDESEAARLFKLSAGQGYAPGQYNLALYYEQGRGGLAKDDAEAARLLKLAADQGDISAQKELAELDKVVRSVVLESPTQRVTSGKPRRLLSSAKSS
jgi:TPR repeat protein